MTPLEILDYIIDHEEKNLILFSDPKEIIETLKFSKDCIKFVTHIQNHLVKMGKPTEKVICKICGKTIAEIAYERTS